MEADYRVTMFHEVDVSKISKSSVQAGMDIIPVSQWCAGELALRITKILFKMALICRVRKFPWLKNTNF